MPCDKNKDANSNNKDTLIGSCFGCYSGYAKNEKIRYNSSSGGVITALLTFALENKIITGAIVARQKNDNILFGESFLAKTKEEIIQSQKSKYIPVLMDNVLKKFSNFTLEEKIAVVGLPCQFSAIEKSGFKEKVYYKFGLFCGHTPSSHGLDLFLNKVAKIKKEEIDKIDFRGQGWPGNVSIFKKDGTILKFSFSFFWSIVGSIFFYPKKCLGCSDCLCNSSDISFGDAWLPEFKKDSLGHSLIIARTQKGVDLLKKAEKAGVIEIFPVLPQKVLLSQITTIYIKKKMLNYFYGNKKEGLKLSILDCLLFFLFSASLFLAKNNFFKKILYILPPKFFYLHTGFLGRIYNRKAKHDFKEFIS